MGLIARIWLWLVAIAYRIRGVKPADKIADPSDTRIIRARRNLDAARATMGKAMAKVEHWQAELKAAKAAKSGG